MDGMSDGAIGRRRTYVQGVCRPDVISTKMDFGAWEFGSLRMAGEYQGVLESESLGV